MAEQNSDVQAVADEDTMHKIIAGCESSRSQLTVAQHIKASAKNPTRFLDLPREIRDSIYLEYFAQQANDSFESKDARNFYCYACDHTPYERDCYTFPILFTCQQILREFQDLLIRYGMHLQFDCIVPMKPFMDNQHQAYLKANLTSLCFNWRGGSETCVTAAHAIIGLQTLPSLKNLIIVITPSVPMRARFKYIANEMSYDSGQDITFRIMQAIGFDELCSIRGLHERVEVRLEGRWLGVAGMPFNIRLPSEGLYASELRYLRLMQTALSRYLSMFMTRKKPLDYDSTKKLRVPYYAWSDDHDVTWIGWDKENEEQRLEGEDLNGW
ncbi:hypothetical protein ONS95_000186 [Cadophora gregata]|uniref:uncharacterized protein n=1 Tax=Cadophora gregata TaxID=51156 RepID=UPI0026DD3987|nr:uncharacterized protein ONS95_000186 [Cadophora gregata]KAK0115535.1 hypothetical protein ONS96_013989 [Cadophora gregata f. sp. sojae]KAK0128209.1 hypothetical protein ONS95_000186 [Cadophora gregata]